MLDICLNLAYGELIVWSGKFLLFFDFPVDDLSWALNIFLFIQQSLSFEFMIFVLAVKQALALVYFDILDFPQIFFYHKCLFSGSISLS